MKTLNIIKDPIYRHSINLIQHKFYSDSEKKMTIPAEADNKADRVVKNIVSSRTPKELADVFAEHPILNENLFRNALDLTYKTEDTKEGANLKDVIYGLIYIEYGINEGIMKERRAKRYARKLTNSFYKRIAEGKE